MPLEKQSQFASTPATYGVADGVSKDQGNSIDTVQLSKQRHTQPRQNSDLKRSNVDGFDFAGVAG